MSGRLWRFTCPHCGRELEAGAERPGDVVPCPGCGRQVAVPDGATPNDKWSSLLAKLPPALRDNPQVAMAVGLGGFIVAVALCLGLVALAARLLQ